MFISEVNALYGTNTILCYGYDKKVCQYYVEASCTSMLSSAVVNVAVVCLTTSYSVFISNQSV